MESFSLKFPKLKGSSNWDIWALRATAWLTEKGYTAVMREPTESPPIQPPEKVDDPTQQQELKRAWDTYREQLATYNAYINNRRQQSYRAAASIRLLLEDGPLLQTKGLEQAEDLWKRLSDLYEPKGFSSEFLLCKELFSSSLTASNGSIEAYLTRIKRLTDELQARRLPIPSKVIAAYTLSNLTPEWENTVAIISQTYRGTQGDINLVQLFG